MKIDRRISNGLAWAGVVLVVGVPAADYLSARLMGDDRPAQVAVIEPEAAALPVTKPASVVAATTPPKTVPSSNAVDNFIQGGKALPSYITDGDAPAQTAAKPASQPAAPAVAAKPPATEQAAVTTPPVVPKPAATQDVAATTPKPQPTPAVAAPAIDPVEVASVPLPGKVAPVPMPLSMRPKPTAPVFAASEPPLIIPDRVVPTTTDRVIAATPDRVVAPLPPANVTASDLDDWESGPLSEFLAQRQRQQGGSSAEVTYDEDGFFLDDGPNMQPRGDQYIGPASDDAYFLPFGN